MSDPYGRIVYFCVECGGELTLRIEGLTMTATQRHRTDCSLRPQPPATSPIEEALREALKAPAAEPPHPLCMGPGLAGWRG